MIYHIAFGLPAALLSAALYVVLDRVLTWPHYYFTWVLSISAVTFAYYGLDKGLSMARNARVRVPELVLNLLAVAGGSLGAWLGRALFRHKTSFRRHWPMFVILLASTLLHAYILQALYSETLNLDW
ncbi:MAG: DUF1294 domain-containing protein [Anaerolineae bacterium]|nr:DUF1294 domain-containing protein [Anaerolineae bacterium]